MKIYDSAEMRKWDEFTIKNEPISSVDLMERAASVCAKHILGSFAFESTDIFCGPGNNGGDGLVIARILESRGINVQVVIIDITGEFSEDFSINLKRLPKSISPVILKSTSNDFEFKGELIIDAIFGSGLNRPVDGWIGDITDKINQSKKPIISVDMPSGLFAFDNRKNNLAHVLEANLTISFQCPKMVFFYPDYHQFVGDLKIIDIGLSNYFQEDSIYEFIKQLNLKLKKRKKFSHKGSHGYLTVVAGLENMVGAAILCTKAAYRTGCGYVGARCAENGLQALMSQIPEAVWLDDKSDYFPPKTTAIAIGPGLGTKEKSLELLTMAIESKLPLVIDADAINLIATDKINPESIPENSILTPHIGELQRLIGLADSDEEFLEKQIEFSTKYKIYIIQKGANSKLTCPDGKVFINSTGNPGMASAGMGDALTGIIGSLLAQGYTSEESAKYGMYIHGAAGDLVLREKGERGMLTSDLIEMIPRVMNSI